MDNNSWSVNQYGVDFYKKWHKDTKRGLYIAAPSMLVFYLGAGILIFDFTLKYVLISIVPVLLISQAFIRPYFYRKKLFNRTAKNIEVKGNVLALETFPWFGHAGSVYTFKLNDIKPTKYNGSFFRNDTVWMFHDDTLDSNFYVARNFFDEPLDFLLKQ